MGCPGRSASLEVFKLRSDRALSAMISPMIWLNSIILKFFPNVIDSMILILLAEVLQCRENVFL